MTDEERHKLVDDLWLIAGHDRPVSHAICAEAADEIERLAKELANANRLLEINRRRSLEKSGGLEIKQSNAAAHVQHLRKRIRELEAEKRAIYTAPPCPDASAGLSVEQYKRLVQLEARVEALERM